jgi:transcriptional regulator with XRE-family HTH domain
MSKNAKNVVEEIIGVVTVGSLFRTYRHTHELTLEKLAKKLKITKLQLSFSSKLDEPKIVYARVWCEEEVRAAGLDFEDLVKII